MVCDKDLACLWRKILLIREKMAVFSSKSVCFSASSVLHTCSLLSFPCLTHLCVLLTWPCSPQQLSFSSSPHFPGATVFLNTIQLSSLITSMKTSASIIPPNSWSPFAECPYAFESSRMIQPFMVMRRACFYDSHCPAEFREWMLEFLKFKAS